MIHDLSTVPSRISERYTWCYRNSNGDINTWQGTIQRQWKDKPYSIGYYKTI